jgi:hypothetical protein
VSNYIDEEEVMVLGKEGKIVGVEEFFYLIAMKRAEEVRIYPNEYVYYWEEKKWNIVRFRGGNGKIREKGKNRQEN